MHAWNEQRLSVGVFYTRWLNAKVRTVEEMARELPVLGLSETWLETQDIDITQGLDTSVETTKTTNLARRQGEAGSTINALQQY